jgi:hypothetical protein
MAQKVTLVLSDEAQKIIGANATERTRGEWVSRIVCEWATMREVDGVGTIERLSAEIVRLRDEIQHWIGAWNK